jgi:hypothetical protein
VWVLDEKFLGRGNNNRRGYNNHCPVVTSHFTCKQQPLRHEKNPSKADAKIEKYASSLLSK